MGILNKIMVSTLVSFTRNIDFVEICFTGWKDLIPPPSPIVTNSGVYTKHFHYHSHVVKNIRCENHWTYLYTSFFSCVVLTLYLTPVVF